MMKTKQKQRATGEKKGNHVYCTVDAPQALVLETLDSAYYPLDKSLSIG